MAENGTNRLPPKQQKAIEALAAGAKVEEAALAARCGVRTLRRWLTQDDFIEELRHFLAMASDEHMRALTSELATNRKVMTGARDDTQASWQIRLRAAEMLSAELARWKEHVDFEERLLALERRLSEQESEKYGRR